MTEHTLIVENRGLLVGDVYCTCGEWLIGGDVTISYAERAHAEHVQREADWDAIGEALDDCRQHWVEVLYARPIVLDAAVEALARLRGMR